MLGKPIIEFIEIDEEISSNFNLIVTKNGDVLNLKIPFHLPYQNQKIVYDDVDELIMFDGNFYRGTSKVFENDTLFTGYQKENLTRQNVFELMAQVSQNLNEEKKNDPLKSLVEVLKHISKHYLKSDAKYIIYFWNFETINTHSFTSKICFSPQLDFFSPPPQV